MVNAISSASLSQAVSHQKAALPKPHQASATAPKDTVQISPEAKARASGDVNRGGNRH